jgi:hypothetical protein
MGVIVIACFQACVGIGIAIADKYESYNFRGCLYLRFRIIIFYLKLFFR